MEQSLTSYISKLAFPFPTPTALVRLTASQSEAAKEWPKDDNPP